MNEELLAKLASNKKYGDVHPDAIRRAIAECEGRYKKAKDLEKAVRERLHGITSAFNGLDRARPSDDLEHLLSCHTSTKERLPLERMDAMYSRVFEVTGEPQSILDLACGLNPLYLLRLYPCPVTGVDVSRSCVELLCAEPNFTGRWADLLSEDAVPTERFHIALLFKILPLLERQSSGAAAELMERIDAEYLVISFPTRTLGGRNVGMERNYSEWMEAHIPEGRAVAERFTIENELFYILKEN